MTQPSSVRLLYEYKDSQSFFHYTYGTAENTTEFEVTSPVAFTASVQATLVSYEFNLPNNKPTYVLANGTIPKPLEGVQLTSVAYQRTEQATTSVVPSPSKTSSSIVAGTTVTTSGSTPTSTKSRTPQISALDNFEVGNSANGTNADGTYICIPTPNGTGSNCIRTSTSSDSSPDGALKASVSVLAALFILSLVGFLFLLFRRRNRKDTEPHSAPFIAPPSDPSHAIGSEKARITALEQQLQAAQTSLLATAVSKPAPIDDRTIASRFDGLAQEIKDWSLTHLRRNPGPHEFSPELREVLRARVPDYERLLTVPKTRGLVVRAAVSALLVDAFEDGYLFPGGSEVRAVEKGMRKNSTPAPIFTQDMR